MKLNLTKPLIFFDLETTGVNFLEDRIVELSYIKVFPDGTEEQQTYRINPGRHIPQEATDIHHITDQMVAEAPHFREIAPQIAETFAHCDIAGFNSNKFDLPLLLEEFYRAQVDFDRSDIRLVDVQTIFHKKEQRTLSAAYRFYCDKNLEDAHSAAADIRATYEVLMAQLDRYTDLENDIDFLSRFSSQTRSVDLANRIILDDNDREVFNFGKYKGKNVEETFRREPGYYSWMMQGDFSSDTKQVITRIYKRK